MILPDVNVLIHAHNSDSPVHDRARAWWDECLAGTAGVGLAWVVLLGFVRISTNRKILLRPLPIGDVMKRMHSWLSMPHVHIPHPSDRHFEGLRQAFEALGTAGNLTTDAHLATLAIQRGYILYSTDTDFARFPGLRWVNPCVG
jgi:toxin-antitoxin system PIN domain toxin